MMNKNMSRKSSSKEYYACAKSLPPSLTSEAKEKDKKGLGVGAGHNNDYKSLMPNNAFWKEYLDHYKKIGGMYSTIRSVMLPTHEEADDELSPLTLGKSVPSIASVSAASPNIISNGAGAASTESDTDSGYHSKSSQISVASGSVVPIEANRLKTVSHSSDTDNEIHELGKLVLRNIKKDDGWNFDNIDNALFMLV